MPKEDVKLESFWG